MVINNKYYIYVYLDKTNEGVFPVFGTHILFRYEPFYVGKGKDKRCFISNHMHSTNKYLVNKLLKLKDNVLVIKVSINLTEQEALEGEKFLINKIGKKIDKKGTLVNIMDCGFGTNGFKHNDYTKFKISEAGKNRKVSIESRKKISDSISGEKHWAYGTKLSEKHIQKIKEANSKKRSAEHVEKIRLLKCKKVAKIDLIDGSIIKIYESVEQAKKENKVTTISKVCRGERKKSGGYGWKYI